MKTTIGRPIDVGDSLSRSVNILLTNKSIILIQVIPAIPSLIGDIVSKSRFGGIALITTIIYFVLVIIATGAFPLAVKTVLAGQRPSLGACFSHAASKFWTLLVAGIVVGIAIILGLIALIVPGIIFVTWWAYTIPAIMLENKGAFEGMSASRAFGHDKKWNTFLMLLVVGAVTLVVVGVIEVAVSIASPVAGRVVGTLVSIPFDAWFSVIVSYTYITYGPSSSPSSEGMTAPPGQPFQAGPGPSVRFCPSCGASVPPGSKFCASCGAPIQ